MTSGFDPDQVPTGRVGFGRRLGASPMLGTNTSLVIDPAPLAETVVAAAGVAARAKAGAHLVALDVDGTLMTFDECISDEIREVIPALRAAGHEIVLATGRPLAAVLPVAAELGLADGWVISSNGSVTARLAPGSSPGFVLDNVVRFDPQPALAILRAHMPEAQIAIEEIGVGFWVTEGFPEHATHGRHSVLDVDQLEMLSAVRIVVAGAQAATRTFCEALEELDLVGTTFTIAATRWMDIAPVGLTKAYALERLRALCAIPSEQTLAIGDGGNDIDMLGWAGRGVAMGHAEADVIAAADEVTLSILDDGALPVLRGLLGRD